MKSLEDEKNAKHNNDKKEIRENKDKDNETTDNTSVSSCCECNLQKTTRYFQISI